MSNSRTIESIASRIRITKIVSSHSTGHDFVSMSVEPPEGEAFTLEEAQIAEKLLSHEVIKATHLDGLVRGTMSKAKFASVKQKIDENYEKLLTRMTQET
jgi:hypothetical protein